MSKFIAVCSFVLSMVALAFAAAVYLRSDAIADQAIQRREQQLVHRLQPKVHAIYHDLGVRLTPAAEHPQSLDELFAPMIDLATSIEPNH